MKVATSDAAQRANAPMGASLTLDRVCKNYGVAAAVRDVDLTVAPGEFVTLLGASGSGKTTTLMMIAGFTEASSGDILLNGRSVKGLTPAKRDLGVVFQNYALFPHLTVAQNVAFPLEMRGLGRAECGERVRTILAMVHLADKGDRYPRQLSGGQQQRVALARALVFNPGALLMDEPLGALDKKLRENMQLEIKRIQARLGATVIYVTHDQEEALTMSDRVAVMGDGRIVQIGAPSELYERPATRWVADFIGQSNFLEGRVEGHEPDGMIAVRFPTGELALARGRDRPPTGAVVTVVLRPEKARSTLPRESAAASVNRLSGVVTEVVYLGHAIRRTIALRTGTTVVLQEANRSGARALPPGAAIDFHWAAEDGWVLPAGEART